MKKAIEEVRQVRLNHDPNYCRLKAEIARLTSELVECEKEIKILEEEKL